MRDATVAGWPGGWIESRGVLTYTLGPSVR